jgi:RimJ/RimL family protein N-acetyltransferase
MYFKKLVGKKCYLSPIDIDDAEKYTAWLNDMDVTVNLLWYNKPLDLNTEKQKLAEIAKGHNYGIIDIGNDESIGICSFHDLDHVNQTGEIGIFIGNKNYWNKGYGTEALTLLLDYGFKALNLHNIMLRVFEYNNNAKRCYEKVGFKIIGKRRKALHRNLKKHDIIYMDILSNEFYERYKQ